jgi:regulatory protein YycI of two-component signal transduction system YycFG
MDLSRAKTVLICTFLILNVFLYYQILQDEGRGNTGLFGRKEEMSRLESALQEAGLFLETPLPRGGIRLAYLVVEPWRFQPEEIIFTLWGALQNGEKAFPAGHGELNIFHSNNEDNLAEYHFGEYKLLVSKEGLVTLKRTRDAKLQQVYSLEESEQIAQEFNGKVSFLSNFIYDYSQKKEKGIVLNYRQEYEGFPLYAGYLQLFMKGETPTEFYLYRLEPVGFAEQKREIIPPSTALLRFIEAYTGNKEKTGIVEFSLGFYSHEYDAERWEIPPVWRIRLDDGEVYYINAFTGILEQ